jgi:hypothetical protein
MACVSQKKSVNRGRSAGSIRPPAPRRPERPAGTFRSLRILLRITTELEDSPIELKDLPIE